MNQEGVGCTLVATGRPDSEGVRGATKNQTALKIGWAALIMYMLQASITTHSCDNRMAHHNTTLVEDQVQGRCGTKLRAVATSYPHHTSAPLKTDFGV